MILNRKFHFPRVQWNAFIALFASAIVLYVLFHCTLCVFDKSHPSKCFSYGDRSLFHPHIRNSVNGIYCKMAGAYSKPFNISLFWYYIKQIMNVFIRAMVRIFSFGERWNGTFHDLAVVSRMEHSIFHLMKIFLPLHS